MKSVHNKCNSASDCIATVQIMSINQNLKVASYCRFLGNLMLKKVQRIVIAKDAKSKGVRNCTVVVRLESNPHKNRLNF